MDKLIRDTLNEVLDEIISEENNIINVIPESGGEEESGGGGGEFLHGDLCYSFHQQRFNSSLVD